MDDMCGGYLGDDCSPQRWLDFFGDTANEFIPWNIDFKVVPTGETIEGMDKSKWKTNYHFIYLFI